MKSVKTFLAAALCSAALPAFAVTPPEVVNYYADIAAAKHANSLTTAQTLQTAVAALIATPSDETLTAAFIKDTLHEADGIESNVASGYHAIEFMLWGQDLNGTGPGAGAWPFTDYATGDACTNGNSDRRAAYLQDATDLLVANLEEMAANWAADGATRAAVTADATAGLNAMLTGMGSLFYGELAGERMKLGLLLNDHE